MYTRNSCKEVRAVTLQIYAPNKIYSKRIVWSLENEKEKEETGEAEAEAEAAAEVKEEERRRKVNVESI